MEDLLYNISVINARIILDMKYATSDNFLRRSLYSRAKAYARKTVAFKLDRVQKELEKRGLGLKIWDAYRPLPVQQELWNMMPDERYVADPKKGSAHNRGAAVDVTLVDSYGNELAMPTAFDDFSERAHLDYMDLPEDVLAHRALLVQAMKDQGFVPLKTEWWHYSDTEAEAYKLLSISFEELEMLQAPS